MSPQVSETRSTVYQNTDLWRGDSLQLQADENETNVTNSQTATFVDKDVGNIISYDGLPSLTTSDMQDKVDLGNFLSRPVLISTLSWTISSLADTVLDPWTLLLDNQYIKYKIHNFAYLRGNLHIKIVVNASPFYYGSAIAAYTPLYSHIPSIPSYTGNNKITWSQRPHIWIYPQSNTGGEMVLPFLWPQNSVIVSSASSVAELGRLHIFKYVDLASANGATNNGCTIQVYAWLENVELRVPTVGLALQGDEYSDGPISRPASALANTASWFENIPIIAPFATATRMGAQAVSAIASLFGWSNPPVISNVMPYKHLASASISEPTSKITLDPKAELSVDPRIVGLDSIDELSISYLVQKESFLSQYAWACDDSVGDMLFNLRVTPTLQGSYNATTHYQVNATPMSYISNLFQYWRGDIIFKLVIIASQYHRGRLRVTWDPINTTGSADQSHIAFTKVIDLGDTTETEIRIPYAQIYPWLSANMRYTTEGFSTGALSNTLSATNGTMTVRVLTNLSAPIDVAPVTVQLFVRGAENLEFACPRDVDHHLQHFELEGDMYTSDALTQDRIKDKDTDPMEPSSVSPERYLVNFGEAIPSLRVLMRRSTLVDCRKTLGFVANTISRRTMTQGRRPPSPGYDPEGFLEAKGVLVPTSEFPYNYCRHTPISFISPLFLMGRGAVRWHFMLNAGKQKVERFAVCRIVQLITSSTNQGATNVLRNDVSVEEQTAQEMTYTSKTETISGSVLTDATVQPSLTCEMSMMHPLKFFLTNPSDSLIGNSFDGTTYDNYSVSYDIDGYESDNDHISLERWVCAGTDYNLHFFMNAPVQYYSSSAGTIPDE